MVRISWSDLRMPASEGVSQRHMLCLLRSYQCCILMLGMHGIRCDLPATHPCIWLRHRL